MELSECEARREDVDGYVMMKEILRAGDIAEAVDFYGDDLGEAEEAGANKAVAEYLLGATSPKGREVKFILAMVDKAVRSARYQLALSESIAEADCDIDISPSAVQTLVNLAAQIGFGLDEALGDEHTELRMILLKKVANALEGFIDEDNLDQGVLTVYAASVEKLMKLTRISACDDKKHLPWLKKCVAAARLLVKAEPDSERYLQALAYYLDSLADFTKGPTARQLYLESLEQLHKLRDLGFDSDSFLHDLSVAYDKMGDAEPKGAPAQSRDWYLKCLELREQLISRDNRNYQEGMFVSPVKKLFAFKGNPSVAFYEKVLLILDKAGDAAPDDVDLQLLMNTVVAELLKLTDFASSDSARSWFEIEAKALERVVKNDGTVPRYFWWLSDSYKGLAEYHRRKDPVRAFELYSLCLDNREKVIEMDGDRLCYSCGIRPVMLDINQMVEAYLPESRKRWYGRWLRIADSCRSLCDYEQVMERELDVASLRDKLG